MSGRDEGTGISAPPADAEDEEEEDEAQEDEAEERLALWLVQWLRCSQ